MTEFNFDCVEPDCKEKVKYVRDEVVILKSLNKNLIAKRKMKKVRVYLTCKKGHCHPYEIEIEDTGHSETSVWRN
ncbi:MAG: hypothetical protein WC455_07220 [Dehalococcoidia bacterium]|jgi:hypothetical protein